MTKTESKIIPPMENTVRIEITCPICKKVHDIVLPMDTAVRLQQRLTNGEHIQDILPGEENAALREKILSGMCDKCQNEFFNDSEWEDEEDEQ